MKFSIKDFYSKCGQTFIFMRIWPHLLKNSLVENVISCAVYRMNEFATNFSYDYLLLCKCMYVYAL